MQFKIYIPNAPRIDASALKDCGLDDLQRDCGPDFERVPAGRGLGEDKPAGLVGQWKIQGSPQLNAPDGIPEEFEWTPSPPSGDYPKGAYWLGINPEQKPGPLELARRKQLQGIPVELSDGRKWSIPIARGAPYSVGLDYETGEPLAVCDERFRKYSERTFRHAMLLAEREEELATLKKVFFGVKMTDEDIQELYVGNRMRFEQYSSLQEIDRELGVAILFDEALEHSVDALSINYRMNQFMVLHFQLLEVSMEKNHLRDICLAAMEAWEIAESLKKNEEARQISLLAG